MSSIKTAIVTTAAARRTSAAAPKSQAVCQDSNISSCQVMKALCGITRRVTLSCPVTCRLCHPGQPLTSAELSAMSHYLYHRPRPNVALLLYPTTPQVSTTVQTSTPKNPVTSPVRISSKSTLKARFTVTSQQTPKTSVLSPASGISSVKTATASPSTPAAATVTSSTSTTTTTSTTTSTSTTATTTPKIIFTPPPFPPMCYQCGSNTRPCSPLELYTGRPKQCPIGTYYCMTDIVQTGGRRSTWKRCVGTDVCLSEWYYGSSDQTECVSFNPATSRNDVDCHFCCVGDNCNSGFKPQMSSLFNPNAKP